MSLQLEDLIAVYPNPEIPEIQTVVTGKKEFNELASSVSEPPPPRPGMYFKHQELIGRLMLFLDNIFLIHRTGTGKTCSIVRVAEYFKKIRENNGHIRRAYVLVKGPSLKNEFKRQLLCVCTAGDYITDLVKNASSEKSRKSNITNATKTWYGIKTYAKFVNKILRATEGMSEEQANEYIIRKYSNVIFFVDEVHNLRIDSDSGLSQNEVRPVYAQLWRVFHLIKNSKIILASATPMINNANEIGPLMNLILPADQQIPENFDYAHATIEQMEPYFRGRLSFVRELETGAILEFQGELIDTSYTIDGREIPSQTRVYPSTMSELQRSGFASAQEQGENSFYTAQREASTFVFPDGTYGHTGFKKYVEVEGPNRYQASPDLLLYLQNLDYMRVLSCKFAEIVRLCMEEPGNCFIYTDYAYIGAVMLGLCFEGMGFEKFNETASIFTAIGGKGGLPPVCASRDNVEGRQVRIPPRPRYALLTSDTFKDSEAKVHTMMEAFNSYENRHGDYIKVMIGSPVARDGINLANVLQVHIASASWNPSSTYQAISRAIRATSHVPLLDEERERLRATGVENPQPKITVKIYKHVAVTQDGDSVDIGMYVLSESKEIEIKRMERIMKRCAIDCQIHYKRNVRPTDVDYTSTCDYDICAYECSNPPPEYLDTDTYDVIYSEGEIQGAMNLIIQLFKLNFSAKLEQIYQALSNIRQRFIDMAIERIVSGKLILYDRFGYPSYLREDGDTLFLTRDFPVVTTSQLRDKYALNVYTSNLIVNKITKLTDYVSALQIDEQYNLIQVLISIPPDNPRFDIILDQLNIDTKVNILEDAIIQQFVEDKPSDYTRGIIEKFSNVIYYENEPVTEINRSAVALANRGKGRGRKPKADTKLKITRLHSNTQAPLIDEDTELVYIHILYTQVPERLSYSTNSKQAKADGRIRILKPSEGTGWRDTNPYEYAVYNAIIQQKNAERVSPYEKFEIYGTILHDKKFRIVNRRAENTEKSLHDARSKNKGKECSTWKKPDLIDLLWVLQIQPPPSISLEVTDRQSLIDYLISQNTGLTEERCAEFSDEQVQFYYKWWRSGASRKIICTKIQEHLAAIGALLVV